jgi:protease-4
LNVESEKSTASENLSKPEWQLLEKTLTASLIEQRRSRRWGVFFKLLTFSYLFFLLVLAFPNNFSGLEAEEKDHVALVSVEGIIAADSAANANSIVTGLRHAFEAEHSRAIIIAINSPGGSPVQAGYVNDEIKRLRTLHPDKKVYSVIADIGASGGYYIAVAADEIYADKASLVGSIGVISAGFGFTGLMEKLGIERRAYAAGENKAFLDPFVAEREGEKQFWQEVLKVTHNQFINVVKEGRGDRLLSDPEIFSGLVWSGEQAVGMGLIDGLASAGRVAREIVGVDKIVDYTMKPNPFEKFAKKLGSQFSASVLDGMHAGLH